METNFKARFLVFGSPSGQSKTFQAPGLVAGFSSQYGAVSTTSWSSPAMRTAIFQIRGASWHCSCQSPPTHRETRTRWLVVTRPPPPRSPALPRHLFQCRGPGQWRSGDSGSLFLLSKSGSRWLFVAFFSGGSALIGAFVACHRQYSQLARLMF